MVSAISGDLIGGLSTHHFLKLAQKLSGKELKAFLDQWIYASGIPRLDFTHNFSRKRGMLELTVQQDPQHPRYQGPLTVRLHEAEGTFDHIISIDQPTQKFELPFHTKYKRMRLNKRSQRMESKFELERAEHDRAAELAPPPNTERDAEMCTADPELWHEFRKANFDDLERSGARSGGELLEEPSSTLSHGSVSWMRLDPELGLPCLISYHQTDFMWTQQLMRDKDVIAQYEAIQHLERHHPTATVSCFLFKFMMDVRAFYRVRMEVAYALARGFCMKQIEFVGLKHLFLAYRKKFCIHHQRFDYIYVPHKNDFRAFSEYFVQQSIPLALAHVHLDGASYAPDLVKRFLISQLAFNDNSINSFSDCYYIASLIRSLDTAFAHPKKPLEPGDSVDSSDPLLMDALIEVDRYLYQDSILSSHRNVVACSCLSVLYGLMNRGLVVATLRPFLLYSRVGNFIDIRWGESEDGCADGF